MKIVTLSTPDKNIPNQYIAVWPCPKCERCGKLEDFDPIFILEEEKINLCLFCADVGGYIDLTKKEEKELFNTVVAAKLNYLTNEIKRVQSFKMKDIIPV